MSSLQFRKEFDNYEYLTKSLNPPQYAEFHESLFQVYFGFQTTERERREEFFRQLYQLPDVEKINLAQYVELWNAHFMMRVSLPSARDKATEEFFGILRKVTNVPQGK